MASLPNEKNTSPRNQETTSSSKSAIDMLQDLSKSLKFSGLSFLDCKIKGMDEIIPEVLSLKFNDNSNGKQVH